jgi:hypothetical protein
MVYATLDMCFKQKNKNIYALLVCKGTEKTVLR